MAIAQLELHYHLRGNAHAMDAIVRNKSEAEALAAFLQIAQLLGVAVQLESSAYREGGLREVWRFIGASKDQLGWILAIIILIFSRFPTSDAETEALNKEVLRLTIEEKKANLEKLRRELSKDSPKEATVDRAANALEGDLKVATRRSNFYRGLLSHEEVTAVGFTPLSDSQVVRPDERTVPRGDFIKFILLTNKLPVEVIDEAQIEIVAPVLKEGNYQWKGIYRGEPITFAMSDERFRASVLLRQVSFQHGSTIQCVLHVHRKFDEIGDVAITGYSVATVIAKVEGVVIEETIQGKRHKHSKRQSAGQGKLFEAPQ